MRIGLIGDHNPAVVAHTAIPLALQQSAAALGVAVETAWLPTNALQHMSNTELSEYAGFWCTPGSPYHSMEGALRGIRWARKQSVPFLGTCGGFQHALLEVARNVRGLSQADHAESTPDAALPVVSLLSCALVEQTGTVTLREGSRVAEACQTTQLEETYHCRYGLNPCYQTALEQGGIHFTGLDPNDEVRVLELPEHPFFIATLFQPERAALKQQTHPLVVAFVQAMAQRSLDTKRPKGTRPLSPW